MRRSRSAGSGLGTADSNASVYGWRGVITNARGEGLEEKKTFLGLGLETQRDMVLLLVEEHRARHVMETLGRVGEFDTTPGTGIAFQIDVEDAVGVAHQVRSITPSLEEEEL